MRVSRMVIVCGLAQSTRVCIIVKEGEVCEGLRATRDGTHVAMGGCSPAPSVCRNSATISSCGKGERLCKHVLVCSIVLC